MQRRAISPSKGRNVALHMNTQKKASRLALLVTRARALGMIGLMPAVLNASQSEVREEVALATSGQDNGGLAQDDNAMPVSADMVRAIERAKRAKDKETDYLLTKAERNALLREMHAQRSRNVSHWEETRQGEADMADAIHAQA